MTPPSPLLTDLYQLTMAQAYWKEGMHDWTASFNMHFRKAPFGGGYAIFCGLEDAVRHASHLKFAHDELAYLSGLKAEDNSPLFEAKFLDYLREVSSSLDIDAIAEGSIVFPQEPLIRVEGPLLQCQLIETALLNHVNFQTLIATKASRMAAAAGGAPIVEFGLRRAQGPDGGLSASRAAYVGGVSATSNVLAGKNYGIPVRGTHAHSWVMCFDSEPEAFAAYARAMPHNALFLVDTYDTLEGVRHAVEAGRALKSQGRRLLGVRLDSGDLAALAGAARKLLDEAGFQDAAIVASNDLDEEGIAALRARGAPIAVWGVGTRLVTGWGQPALGGVFKLSALRRPGGAWRHRIKVSDDPIKTTTPGRLQVRRFSDKGRPALDMVWDIDAPPPASPTLIDPADSTRLQRVPEGASGEDLLLPALRAGRPAGERPLGEARARAAGAVASLSPETLALSKPKPYPVMLEAGLYARKTRLIHEARMRLGRASQEAAP